MLIPIIPLQDYPVEFYDQTSSQSSTGAYSGNGATPSPGPLTPTPTHMLVGTFETAERSPAIKTEPEQGHVQFQYLNMYNAKSSPIKLIPLNDDLGLDIRPLKGAELNRQFIKTRKLLFKIDFFPKNRVNGDLEKLKKSRLYR